ncbi:carbohydrate ABC transporter permease [Streptodolium elevatio]|uniref:Carbohydrate ABC transporter permease n=1 Tax=Streptodolium elevatio TaxID=3157996 RepID=A0ABV3DUH9_9ACTN
MLVIGALYSVFPLIWLVTAAAKSPNNLLGTSMFQVDGAAIGDNIQRVLDQDDGIFLTWFGNSFLYAGAGALGSTIICVAAGYAFDKYRFPFREKLFGFVLVGVLVPVSALALPMYLLASKAGVNNSYWAVFVPSLLNPFGVYLARIFSRSYIPDEVIEAARMDGASDLRVFRSVGLPMMVPGFVTIFLFQFVTIWNNFFLPLVMLSDRKLFPVSLGLYTWNGNTTQSPEFYPLVITGSLLAVLPLIVAFIALQRYWRSGLTMGSVK